MYLCCCSGRIPFCHAWILDAPGLGWLPLANWLDWLAKTTIQTTIQTSKLNNNKQAK